jgi:hypothetical protein
MTGRQGGRKRNPPQSALPPPSVTELRAILDRSVLKTGLQKPSLDALKNLALDVVGLRNLFDKSKNVWSPRDAETERVLMAAQIVLAHLPTLRSEIEEEIPYYMDGGDLWKTTCSRALEAIASAETGLTSLVEDSIGFIRMTRLIPPAERWHDLADTIAHFFIVAMRPNNPTVRFGRSNDGPVPRFVASIIPFITGDTPDVAAVGQHLKRIARKKAKSSR